MKQKLYYDKNSKEPSKLSSGATVRVGQGDNYEAPCVAKILINALNKLKQKYNMKRTHDMLIFDILC